MAAWPGVAGGVGRTVRASRRWGQCDRLSASSARAERSRRPSRRERSCGRRRSRSCSVPSRRSRRVDGAGQIRLRAGLVAR
jgi:hypothetical protein